jgi:hypothetical protein
VLLCTAGGAAASASSLLGADLGVPEGCVAGLGPDTPAPAAGAVSGSYQASAVYGSTSSRPAFIGQRPAEYKIWRQDCGGGRSAVLLRLEDITHYLAPTNLTFPLLHAYLPGQGPVPLAAVRLDGGSVVHTFSSGDIPGTYVLAGANQPLDLNSSFVIDFADPYLV